METIFSSGIYFYLFQANLISPIQLDLFYSYTSYEKNIKDFLLLAAE